MDAKRICGLDVEQLEAELAGYIFRVQELRDEGLEVPEGLLCAIETRQVLLEAYRARALADEIARVREAEDLTPVARMFLELAERVQRGEKVDADVKEMCDVGTLARGVGAAAGGGADEGRGCGQNLRGRARDGVEVD